VGVAVAVALNLGELDSTAHIGGTVSFTTAGMVNVEAEQGGRAWTFSPYDDVDDASGHETIELGTAHGFRTGDSVVYGNGGGTAIGGLEDGKTYFLIVDDAHPSLVKLAASEDDAKDGNSIDLDLSGATGSKHTLTKKALIVYGEATSGGGGENVGVAGSLALNIVTTDEEAYVETGANLNLNQAGLNLTAESTTQITAKAVPQEAATGESVGIGASVAINISDNIVRSEIGTTARSRQSDVDIAARTHKLTPGQSGSEGASHHAVVAVSLANNDVVAGWALPLTGPTRTRSETHSAWMARAVYLFFQALRTRYPPWQPA
jgi:hypothetical protein